MNKRFYQIYHTAGWAQNSGVLSGSGSTVEACNSLANWISQSDCSRILDLGCGDLEWIATIEAISSGKISYYGVDVVESLVAHHKRVFRWFDGEALDMAALSDAKGADLIILKDVLFHLCDDEAAKLMSNIASWKGWRFLIVTTHQGAKRSRGNPQGIFMAPLDVEALAERLTLPVGKSIARLPRPDGGEMIVLDRSVGNMSEGDPLPLPGI